MREDTWGSVCVCVKVINTMRGNSRDGRTVSLGAQGRPLGGGDIRTDS